MQKTLTIALITLTFTSCISTKKIDGFVNQYYSEKVTQFNNESDWLINDTLQKIDTFSTSIKTKAQFIPAILYWQWHTNINTDINNDLVKNRFSQYLAAKSDSLELPKLLNGQKIEFEFSQAPSGFSYIHKGNSVILIVAYTVSYLIAIKPNESPYRLKYRIFNSKNIKTMEGEVKVNNTEIPLNNLWKSAKKFTWTYLDEYHKHQVIAFANLINKIENELKE
jgi:hypothetical protein